MPVPATQRIRVLHGRDNARDARRDQGVHAGRRPSLVRAGLEADVHGRAACPLAGLLQRDDLGVPQAGIRVEAAAHDLAIAHNYRADHRVGAGLRPALARQVERFAHECGVHLFE